MSEALKPLKFTRSTCDTTLSGHEYIYRDGEAPYAYTCAGVAQEIVTAVNSHDALVTALKDLCDYYIPLFGPNVTRGGRWDKARAALKLAGK